MGPAASYRGVIALLPSTLLIALHGIGEFPPGLSEAEAEFWLDRTQFEAILDWMSEEAGPAGIDVRLSFDDGNRSDVDLVLPMLAERGLTADFHIVTGWATRPRHLDRQAVKDLAQAGMTLGSHGCKHVNWTVVDPATLQAEAYDSKAWLEDTLGQEVTLAAAPFGAVNAKVLACLRAAGYATVDTCDDGCSHADAALRFRHCATRAPGLIDRLRARVTLGARMKNALRLPLHRWRLGERA